MDLFEQYRQTITASEAPLAARMRPRSLEEFIGQSAIIGKGRLLRRAIEADQLSSVIFYGPPGTGKTTLARVIANSTRAQFVAINAVLGGVKDIRAAIELAQVQRGQYGQRTLLFIDEVHRFNKAQQDALLPWVENGTVIFIGATTENPFFEVNKALVSRSRVFQLKPLDDDDLKGILTQALGDRERGYGQQKIQIDPAALAHLVDVASGDARTLLNALELAVETTTPNEQGVVHITLPVAEDSIQKRAVLYDKEGDAHFDTISAFIKSIRGSDPDAALYWLARMVYAGEDPRYIFRRLVILAGEDVGMADPNAVVVVNGCAQAFDRVGMPEGRYPLAQATLYLATAPKSNSTMAFFDALAAVEREKAGEVPNAMRDASRDKKGFGHGAGYLYPHAYRDHWVAQQYLPTSLQGQVFYQPSDQGYEARIRVQVARRTEAQLAGLVERNWEHSLPEALTAGPDNTQQDRWLQRASGALGTQLGEVRDRLFQSLSPQRHHVLLDLNASTGLLTWEAVRQVPEGGVFSCTLTDSAYDALTEQSAMLSALSRPQIIRVQPGRWQAALQQPSKQQPSKQQPSKQQPSKQQPSKQCGDAASLAIPRSFDGIISRNALMPLPHKSAAIKEIAQLLSPGGKWTFAETIPAQGQRLSLLLNDTKIEPQRLDAFAQAEARLFQQPNDPLFNWDISHLQNGLSDAALTYELETVTFQTPMFLTLTLLNQWLGSSGKYYGAIAEQSDEAEAEKICRSVIEQLKDTTVRWHRSIVFISAQLS